MKHLILFFYHCWYEIWNLNAHILTFSVALFHFYCKCFLLRNYKQFSTCSASLPLYPVWPNSDIICTLSSIVVHWVNYNSLIWVLHFNIWLLKCSWRGRRAYSLKPPSFFQICRSYLLVKEKIKERWMLFNSQCAVHLKSRFYIW